MILCPVIICRICRTPIENSPHRESSPHGGEFIHDEESSDDSSATSYEYENLAELFDVTNPDTNKDRVLVAAYWLQTRNGSDSFRGYEVNKGLKDLGHGVSNVTDAINKLKAQSPSLVIQLKKSGKSKQARKTYKVTNAGEDAVRQMIQQ